MKTTNNTSKAAKTNVVTAATARSNYAKQREAACRTLGAYLSIMRKDVDGLNYKALEAAAAAAAKAATEAAAAAKADASKADEAKAAKQHAEAAKARAAAAKAHAAAEAVHVQNLRTALEKSALTAEDITPKFLRTWLDFATDADGNICDVKRIALEDEAEARATLEAARLKDVNGTLVYLKPVTLWTFSKVMQKFASAAKQRTKAAAAASAAEREAKRAEAEAKRIEAYKAKIAAYEAKQRSSAADAKILAEAAAKQQQKQAK